MTRRQRPDVVDLGAVSRGLAALDQIAADHPELVDRASRGDDNRGAWETALSQERPMPEPSPHKTTHVGVRVPDDLLIRVDAYAEHVRSTTGVRVSKSAAIVALLRRGLDAVESDPSR